MEIRKMMYVALFAALVAVFGYLPAIPLPFLVPITVQTLGVMLAGDILGSRLGGLSMLLLVILAAIGAPVLSGGSGGLTHLLGPTGGYILSWPIAAFFIGFFVERLGERKTVLKVLAINLIGGILIIYAIGIPYLSYVLNMPISKALIGNLAFIPGDVIKAILAAFITLRLDKVYPIHFSNKDA